MISLYDTADTLSDQDTALLVATAVILLLVLIVILNQRSRTYKKVHALQQDLDREHLRTQALFSAAEQPLLQVDPQGIVLAANQAAHIRLGIKQVPIGIHFTSIVPEYIATKPLAKQQRRKAGGYFVMLQMEDEPTKQPSSLSAKATCQPAVTSLRHVLGHIKELYAQKAATEKNVLPLLHNASAQADVLDRSLRAIERLDSLSKKSHPAPEHVHIGDTVTELYNTYLPQAEEKSLGINLDITSHVGDVITRREYLYELLSILLQNAISYTEKGSVTIKAFKRASMILITVKDTGIGISKSEQDTIFEPHYRSKDHRVRISHGAGVGLYLARQLATAIDATITIKSRLNHGSEFTVELPINTSHITE